MVAVASAAAAVFVIGSLVLFWFSVEIYLFAKRVALTVTTMLRQELVRTAKYEPL